MREVTILLAERRQQPGTHRLGLARIGANLAFERAHRIGGFQGPVIPALDGRGAEAYPFILLGMTVAAAGEELDLLAQFPRLSAVWPITRR